MPTIDRLGRSYLVIQSESQFRHARQVDTHLDCSNDLTPQHVATCTHQQIHRLHHVQEHLILPVLQALRPPGHSVGHSHRWLGCNLKLVALLRDVFLKYLAVCDLRNKHILNIQSI